jgi:hypothetical protein
VRAGLRALAGLIALVVAVVWSAQALHMTLVAHHLCEAHGQLEHREASDHDDTFVGLGVVADEDHEHCDGLAIEPVPAPSVAAPRSLTSELQPLPSSPPIPFDFVRSRWRLAPKTSPPV